MSQDVCHRNIEDDSNLTLLYVMHPITYTRLGNFEVLGDLEALMNKQH